MTILTCFRIVWLLISPTGNSLSLLQVLRECFQRRRWSTMGSLLRLTKSNVELASRLAEAEYQAVCSTTPNKFSHSWICSCRFRASKAFRMWILHRGFGRSRQALGHTSSLLRIHTPTLTFIQKSGVRSGADGDGFFYGSEANSTCLSLLPMICTIRRQDRRSRLWRSHGIVLILKRKTK
jgi:hypothetical protein